MGSEERGGRGAVVAEAQKHTLVSALQLPHARAIRRNRSLLGCCTIKTIRTKLRIHRTSLQEVATLWCRDASRRASSYAWLLRPWGFISSRKWLFVCFRFGLLALQFEANLATSLLYFLLLGIFIGLASLCLGPCIHQCVRIEARATVGHDSAEQFALYMNVIEMLALG